MGQSGIDIMDSDEAMDVHYLYFEKYNAGKPPAEINKWFEENYKFNFQNKVIEDCSSFWLGLALAQWEVKALTPFVLERVTEIIQTDSEKEDWGEDYPERKKALEAFLKKIQKEKKAAQKPVKQRLFKAPFEKGDVITYPIFDAGTSEYTNKWGLSVCLENTTGLQKTASCLLARTLVEKDHPASMEDVSSACVDPYEWYGPAIFSAFICDTDDLEQTEQIRKIGKIVIQRSFAIGNYMSAGWLICFNTEKEKLQNENPEMLHSIKLMDIVSIPDHPYAEWAQKIVYLETLPSEAIDANKDKFKEVAGFLLQLKNDSAVTYREKFIPFIKNYIIQDWDKREEQSPLRRIGIRAGYEGDMFE